MRKVLVAGASGFIGRALIERLLQHEDIEIVGLSRRAQESHHPRLRWRKCDLFSLKDISLAMEGCEEAYYLVHSMLPSASLSQGTFYDFDLIMADNFVRAGREHSIRHIIYLGGMIPNTEELSWHLKSRMEVEQVFKSSGIPTTVLRAGLIIGPQGSSFTIIERLIEKLPVMICPAWTKTKSQPLALNDCVNVLENSLLKKELRGRTYDIAGPEVVTYQELIQKTASKIRKKPRILTLNIIPLMLSRWWITFITRVPKNLVYPLVLSLRHEMLPSKSHAWPFEGDIKTGIDEALDIAVGTPVSLPRKKFSPAQKDVRSIQRMVLPEGRDARWVALTYFEWLPTFFSTLVTVSVMDDVCTFNLFHPNIKILILKRSEERSTPDRQLLYVIGGLLARDTERGRLEFREVLERRYVMAALHEFRPALPWYIYRFTQAVVHIIVMKAFAEHLKWHVISQKRAPL